MFCLLTLWVQWSDVIAILSLLSVIFTWNLKQADLNFAVERKNGGDKRFPRNLKKAIFNFAVEEKELSRLLDI